MKCCQRHWERLTELVKEAGMWHLVHQSTEEAIAEMKEEIESGESAHAFDPLLRAHNMVMGQALHMGGMYLMGQAPDGSEYCPICEAIKGMQNMPLEPGGPPAGAEWVENHWTVDVVDHIKNLMSERGLLHPLH